jgi:hypothetical protein
MDDWNYITDEQRNASRILAPEIAAAMQRSNYQNNYDDIDAFIKLPINKDKIRKYKLDDGYVKKYLIPQIKTAYDNLKGTSMPRFGIRDNTNPMHTLSSADYNYGGTRRKRRKTKSKRRKSKKTRKRRRL